jgi:hypothetical protein
MLAREEVRQSRKKKILTEWLKQTELSPISDFNYKFLKNYGQNYTVRPV